MKRIAVLGSTGSIGTQTLDVCRRLGYEIVALAAGSNAELLEKQAREFSPKLVAAADENAARRLSIALSGTGITVLGGERAVLEAAAAECDIVLNAVTGIAGLRPTIAAVEAGNDIALANKETLVAGGRRVMDYAAEHGVKILPVDSEHSAIFQCLQAKGDYARIKKLILTASGGPFFGKTAAELENMRPEDALRHPTWSMGTKITIDSASMFNKGLEIMEAAYLFDVSGDNIDVLVHPQSIVHSMVEFNDGCVMAQLAVPDMRLAIQYGIMYPKRQQRIVSTLELAKIGALTFEKPDKNKYRAIDLAYLALKADGVMPIAYNAANEVAVDEFIKGRIKFLEIADIVEETLEESARLSVETDTIEGIICADMEARRLAADSVSRICANRR